MSKPDIILIGAGGHAHSCIDVIEQQGQYHIAGLVGMPHEVHDKHLGYEVIATDDDLPQLAKEYGHALISLGQILSPGSRIRLYQQAIKLGFQLPVIVAPTAYVSRHATLGAGTIIMHGAIVTAGVRVGDNCIINNRSLLEHDTTVEDHCHISTGAILNGGVTIGAGSFVGSGTVIKEGVIIGKDCVIGMGLSLRHNQLDHSRYTGKSTS
ncbi:acetyltransferase [Pelodictyon phaeoclathratiforme]|jgi:sugar O-acyltransferase (sialic acid O-acetyltransferase NeuD family)|uniref:Transferase hexapeptide repeat containing protein n=1 Tax=Pelodictyon phaeoclathratiforme (strain DSM 5477 / BU-1) TaxID=324925 RepID=B4SDB1_PELPB|nr:acetyltransferase [Pelodictyon phaeoclathratiforme]ACF42850.1 transferase hexapeptide repeat containing protein [Pelodictyon phaeoclathratiforme BU-1]MBV5326621.1 acetyltransferase [Chlorobium sp.]